MNTKENQKGICPVCGQAVAVTQVGLTNIVCPHKLSRHPESPLHNFLNPKDQINYEIDSHTVKGWGCKGINCTPAKILD